MLNHFYLGPGPAEEEVAQLGRDGFAARNKRECVAWLHQLERVLTAQIQEQGLDVSGIICYLRTKAESHDFGTYREVIVKFDDDDALAVDLAIWLENHTPAHWDEQARQELAQFKQEAQGERHV